jgi:hypothetical protein
MNKAGVYRCLTIDNAIYYVFVTGEVPFLKVVNVLSPQGRQAKLTMYEGDLFIDGPRVTEIKEV